MPTATTLPGKPRILFHGPGVIWHRPRLPMPNLTGVQPTVAAAG
ncbi:hypothetical protein [Paracoccus siganidrum]|nr:hypothetical protein [Paracoccus siganidrum]